MKHILTAFRSRLPAIPSFEEPDLESRGEGMPTGLAYPDLIQEVHARKSQACSRPETSIYGGFRS